MGIVRSIQKGEQPAGKFSKDAQKAAKKMKKSSVKKYAKTKHDDLPIKKESKTSNMMKAIRKGGTAGPWDIIISKNNKIVKRVSVKNLKEIPAEMDDVKKKFPNHKIGIEAKYGKIVYREAKERDYKDEYKKFQSSTKSKKYRAELNKYNRDKGTYGNGDGKDASHKGGKIVGFEKESKNRGRAEKSRLKKENNMPDFNPIIDEVLDEVFGEYQMNESSKVLKSIENLAKQNKYGNVTGTKMNGKTANLIMKIYNHPKMKKYQKAMEKYTSDELVDMTLKMPKVLGIKEDVNEAAMELNKIKDAILMFQKKIKKQGRVTNARDEDHLKNLIKLYKKMGGKGVKESVNEGQKKQGIHESVKKSINEANYTHNYPSITAMAKDYKRIFPSTGPAGGVKIISGSKREATGKRSQPAFIRIEGDKKLIDAYKKIAFNGRGNYSDVIKSLKEGLADKFKKNIDKYNKKAKKSKDALKKYAKLKKK